MYNDFTDAIIIIIMFGVQNNFGIEYIVYFFFFYFGNYCRGFVQKKNNTATISQIK